MAQIVGNKIKLDNGQLVDPQQGGWYDAKQYWGGTLSDPGQINAQSNQIGAGQQVSKEVVQQTNPANWDYIQGEQKKAGVQTFQNDTNNPAFGTPMGGGSGGGVGFSAPQGAPDILGAYEAIQNNPEFLAKKAEMTALTNAYNEAQAKINDNPFLSEASRVGRIQKLSMDYENKAKLLQSEIATMQGDNETQLNLMLKQFDINSQVASQAFDQFNSLLASGALDNASGEDIANITRATGISSSMIQSAIKATREKNRQTSMIQFDDGVNQGFAIIDAQTGEVIKTQSIASSKPKSEGSGILDQQRQFELDSKQAPSAAREAALSGKTLGDMMSFYSQWLDKQKIWDIYSAVNYYKMTDNQRFADQEKYGVE